MANGLPEAGPETPAVNSNGHLCSDGVVLKVTDHDYPPVVNNLTEDASALGIPSNTGPMGPVFIKDSSTISVGNHLNLNGEVTINKYYYHNGVAEDNPIRDVLPLTRDVVVQSEKGEISLKNGLNNPILQIDNHLEKGWVRQWWSWLSCAFAGALVVTVVLLLTMWSAQRPKEDSSTRRTPVQYPFTIPANLTDEDKRFVVSNFDRFVTRIDWSARPPAELTPQSTPVGMVVITHTATNSCSGRRQCIGVVKGIQEFHTESRKWVDIAYNFLVSDDGAIFIGRGWDNYGAHSKGYNIGAVGIAFIGTFTEQIPADDQVAAVKILLEIGVKINKLKDDYVLYGHRQVISTISPGDGVYNIIKTWPHWQKLNNTT